MGWGGQQAERCLWRVQSHEEASYKSVYCLSSHEHATARSISGPALVLGRTTAPPQHPPPKPPADPSPAMRSIIDRREIQRVNESFTHIITC